MKNSLGTILLYILIGTISPMASGVEVTDSINLGIGGVNPMPHCDAKVYLIEYEHLLAPKTSILGRGSGVNYRYNDGSFMEEGGLRGMDIGTRHYASAGMRGFFWGGSLGYWTGDRSFIQYQNSPLQWQGNGNSKFIRLNIDLGSRIPIQGTNISIMPEAHLGKFFSSLTCETTAPASQAGTPCNQNSEVDYYIFFGVTVGASF